ncbi:MAG: hypothetical protein HFH82_09970 [Lachnospiraceae bacterium]|nr:hypothetical protein [Lachnospiraceae bacterium]
MANMREWNEMDNGELSKKSLCEDCIAVQGLIILTLGGLGGFCCVNSRIDAAKSREDSEKLAGCVIAKTVG